jgi:hypothetical protein
MGSLQSETLQKESLRLHPDIRGADPHVDVRRKGEMMYDLKWLEGYSGQTTEELIALEGEYRIDSLVLAFEQALAPSPSGSSWRTGSRYWRWRPRWPRRIPG